MLFNYKNVHELNETELYIRDYVTSHPDETLKMNVRDLADAMNVSTATLVRFTKKLGCDGFADFKKQFREYLAGAYLNSLPSMADGMRKELQRYTTEEYREKITAFIKPIQKARLTVIYGIGKSSGLALYGARSLTDIGINAVPVTDPFYPRLQSDPHRIFFVIISHSGETRESIFQAERYKNNGAVTGCITAHPESTIAKMSDVILDYREPDLYTPEALNLSSEAPALFLIEVIVRQLLGQKFSKVSTTRR